MNSSPNGVSASTRPRFRLSIAELLWLAALCALAAGFVVRVMRAAETNWPTELAFSPDGRLLAARFQRGGIRVWDISGPEPQRFGPPIDPDDVSFYSLTFQFVGPETLAMLRWDAAGQGTNLVLWDVRHNRALQTIRQPGGAYSAAVSPDGRLLAIPSYTLPSGGGIELIDVNQGQRVGFLATAGFPTETLQFCDEGRRIVAVEADFVEVFDVESRRRESSTPIPPHKGAAVSADGRYILYGEDVLERGQAFVANAAGEIKLVIDDVNSSSACFLPGSSQIAVDAKDGVQIWDIPSAKLVRRIELPATYARGLNVSPDGRLLGHATADRISLWDVRTGRHVADVWGRSALLEAGLFSLGFFGWAFVWGRMRRRRPELEPQRAANMASTAADGAASRPRGIVLTFLRLGVLILVLGVLMGLPMAVLVSRSMGDSAWSTLAAVGAVLIAPVVLLLVIVALVFFKKVILHSHAAELRRAAAAAQGPVRMARFGNISAYFFGASTLEAGFEQDLAAVRARLSALLGRVADAPHMPAFCFSSQAEFDAYLVRRFPFSAIYSPPWWGRQIVICDRSEHGMTDPREALRTLLSYALLWNQMGFRLPYWLTMTVNFYATHGDDADQQARVHRRLKAELARLGELGPRPHQLSDKEFLQIALAREQREAFQQHLLCGDVCASLAHYLTGDEDRRRRFGELLRGLTKNADLDAAFREHFGRGLDDLMDDWQAWLRERIADEAELNLRAPRPETVRRQIVEDFVPRVLDAAVEIDVRCRAARCLGGAGSLLGVAALIEALETGPPPLQQDAQWALEAIFGELLGDDPAAWRAALVSATPNDGALPGGVSTACIHSSPSPLAGEGRGVRGEDSPDLPITDAPADVVTAEVAEPAVDALLMDAQQQTETAASATNGGPPHPTSQPLLVAPRAIVLCWMFMMLGGAAAIFLVSYMMFRIGIIWWPLYGYGVAMGVIAVARGAGRHVRGMQLVGLMQVFNLLNCDPINPILGIAILVLLRTRSAREYCAAGG